MVVLYHIDQIAVSVTQLGQFVHRLPVYAIERVPVLQVSKKLYILG